MSAFSVTMFVCVNFLSKISQAVLDLGFLNSVQSLIMISCIVY